MKVKSLGNGESKPGSRMSDPKFYLLSCCLIYEPLNSTSTFFISHASSWNDYTTNMVAQCRFHNSRQGLPGTRYPCTFEAPPYIGLSPARAALVITKVRTTEYQSRVKKESTSSCESIAMPLFEVATPCFAVSSSHRIIPKNFIMFIGRITMICDHATLSLSQ